MRITDAHCHIGPGAAYSQSPEELLRLMDRHEVQSAVVVPADKFIAVYNREGNDLVLEAALQHPGRLIPFAAVNPWYGDKALDELGRALDSGAAGLKLHPPIQGFQITDEIVFPVVELAVSRSKPVYLHTGTAVCSSPFQLTELAMRYPEGTFIMGHAAYADYWNDVEASVGCVSNVYVETSQHLASFVLHLSRQLGAGRIIYGSDSPKADMGIEIEKITRFIELPEERDVILGGNLRGLLGVQ